MTKMEEAEDQNICHACYGGDGLTRQRLVVLGVITARVGITILSKIKTLKE